MAKRMGVPVPVAGTAERIKIYTNPEEAVEAIRQLNDRGEILGLKVMCRKKVEKMADILPELICEDLLLTLEFKLKQRKADRIYIWTDTTTTDGTAQDQRPPRIACLCWLLPGQNIDEILFAVQELP